MAQQSPPAGGLALLAEAFRSEAHGSARRRGRRGGAARELEAGQIAALGPARGSRGGDADAEAERLGVAALERVLSEIGMRKAQPSADAQPAAAPAPPPGTRDRLIERLAGDSRPASRKAARQRRTWWRWRSRPSR
jgi:hypothetical protein